MEENVNAILRKRLLKEFNPESIEENSRAIMTRYLHKAQELYDQFSTQPQIRTPVSIRVCATDALSVDAFISRFFEERRFLVGFSYGLFANLYACFMGLLSHPGILPHIGNGANTECRFSVTDYGLLDFTYDHDVVRKRTPLEGGFPLWNYPKDEDRILYATLLADIAFEFILYHEWGHLLGGHLAYLSQALGIDAIAEMEAFEDKENPSAETIRGEPIRKAMEFEADCIAARMITALATQLPKTGRTFFQAYPPAFLSSFDVRDAIFFSILSLFHLFGETRLKKGLINNLLYPAPYYRFCSLLFGIYVDQDEETMQPWLDYEYRGVTEFANASQVLQFHFLFGKEVYDGRSTRKEISKLHNLLEALRSRLANYRLVTSPNL